MTPDFETCDQCQPTRQRVGQTRKNFATDHTEGHGWEMKRMTGSVLSCLEAYVLAGDFREVRKSAWGAEAARE